MEEVHSLYVLTKMFIVRAFFESPLKIERRYLMGCFKEAEKNMVFSATFFLFQTELPKKVLSDLWKQLLLLHEAYLGALDWIRIMSYETNQTPFEFKLDIASDGIYNYSTYLLPSGEFDDTKWVRKFVKDPQNLILDRFYFACFYCLESDIRMLWQGLVLDENYPRYRQKDFNNIWLLDPDLVSFWIAYIEGKENEYMEEEILKGNSMLLNRSFMFCGLNIAVNSNQLRAVRYFYEKMSAEERDALHSDINIYAEMLIELGSSGGDGKVIDFLFSKLNENQQLLVLQRDVEETSSESVILNSYVHSRLHTKLLEKIGQHQDMLPPIAFSSVLELILLFMKIRDRLINPFDESDNDVYDYENLFIRIWCLGLPILKDYVFNNTLSILSTLFSEKRFRSVAIMLKDSAFGSKFDLLSRQELDKWITLATNTDLASDRYLFDVALSRIRRIVKLYA